MQWYDPLKKLAPDIPRWFRLLVTGIVAAILCSGLLSLMSCTPDARAATLDELEVGMVADSLRVSVGYTVDARADSATVRVTIGSTSQTKRAASLTGTTAFTFAAPAEGATITIAAQVTAYKAGVPPVSVGKNRTWTRPVGPLDPPVIDTIDVGEVAAALGRARITDTTEIVRITGETCRIEQRDYYGRELLIVLDSAAEAAGCEAAVLRVVDRQTPHASVLSFNAQQVRWADSAYAAAGERNRAYLDSVMAGLPVGDPPFTVPHVAELPRVMLDTHDPTLEQPRGPDTLVASGGRVVAIAEYRQGQPGFVWP